ncbi:MAG: protein BatD [Gammaproteobacteria bacterium]|nr:protein BatD [Gammaproteobacteria bacterium]
MVIRFLSCLLLTLITSHAFAVTFEASVDRTSIGEGESLMLTLRYNSNLLSGEPDLSPLEQQFTVANRQRKNSFQYINGRSESWTIWTITLIPKRKGNLVIPSIQFKNESTKPIQIVVSKLDPSLTKQDKDVFFVTEADIKTGYVQSQIVYSEKLYFSVPLDNSQLNEVEVEDAVVQPLGETKQYRTTLNGRSFDVYERRFVIFPQVSGELVIPGPRYSGEISNGRWRPGRPISVSHPPLRIQVLPQPANYPQNASWLPAKDVKLGFRWLGDITKLNQGEPITLALTLTAQGLSAAQLPKLDLPDSKGLKYYPEQTQTNDVANDSGITGIASQNIAVVVNKNGTVRLPEVRIPWFNIESGRVEYATMPGQTLKVSGESTQQVQPSTTNDTSMSSALSEPETHSDIMPVANDSEHSINYWPVVSLVFMLLWLITGYILWRQIQNKGNVESEVTSRQKNISGSLKAIKQACRNNEANQARAAIVAWAQAQGHEHITRLDQVAQLNNDASLKQALQELDYTLYSPDGNSAWQGEYLWQLIRNIESKPDSSHAPLAPLYPNEASS